MDYFVCDCQIKCSQIEVPISCAASLPVMLGIKDIWSCPSSFNFTLVCLMFSVPTIGSWTKASLVHRMPYVSSGLG